MASASSSPGSRTRPPLEHRQTLSERRLPSSLPPPASRTVGLCRRPTRKHRVETRRVASSALDEPAAGELTSRHASCVPGGSRSRSGSRSSRRRALRCGSRRAPSELLGCALIADATAQTALVGGVEPDRDQHRAARRRRLHQLRILERSSVASVRHRRESFGVRCQFGSGVRPFPAANLGVELLAVIAPDPVVHRPRRRADDVPAERVPHRRLTDSPGTGELVHEYVGIAPR